MNEPVGIQQDDDVTVLNKPAAEALYQPRHTSHHDVVDDEIWVVEATEGPNLCLFSSSNKWFKFAKEVRETILRRKIFTEETLRTASFGQQTIVSNKL